MSSPITEVKPSQVAQLMQENAKLKEEIDKLKANDEEAMKLSMRQNELFMSQLEEKHKEIDKLKADCEHHFNLHLSKLTEWGEKEEKLGEEIDKLKDENHSLKEDNEFNLDGFNFYRAAFRELKEEMKKDEDE